MFNYLKMDPEKVEFLPVAGVEDLPTGERLFVEIDNQPIVVFNLAGGLFAIADVCRHDDGPVGDGELEGEEVVCPRHGARFDLRSGGAKSLPAVIGIQTFPVREQNGQIEIGLPK
jgi:3-phenylpropionate/trans-cinnamate dioxygenase ferredoxin subunit